MTAVNDVTKGSRRYETRTHRLEFDYKSSELTSQNWLYLFFNLTFLASEDVKWKPAKVCQVLYP